MKSRIPNFQPRRIGEVHRWFAELYAAGLLYHPDDPAETIVNRVDATRMFSDTEALTLNQAMTKMFDRFGDRVYEVACQYFHHWLHGTWGNSVPRPHD